MRRLRIVIADDSKFMRTLIKRIIESEGHIVVGEAGNGIELLKLINMLDEKPDIVFLDINMPELDGIKTLEILREKYKDLNIVIVSALGRRDIIELASSAGVMFFITKPFTPDKIRDIIKKCMRRSK